MFCNNCGKELTETTAFCPHCGSSLSDNSMKVGTITFFREKAGTAKLVPAKIKIDGQLRGELKQNSSCSALLPMGTHSVEIRASINPIAKYSITIDSSEPNPFFSFKIGISGTAILTPQSRGNFINQTKKTGTLSMIVSLLLTFIVFVSLLFFLIHLKIILIKPTPKTQKSSTIQVLLKPHQVRLGLGRSR